MQPLLHLFVLASGSKGNAAVIQGPDGSILVDCGISWRELGRRADAVGCDLTRVQAVFVTHEHSDHVRGLTTLHKRMEAPLVATAGTAGGSSVTLDLPFDLVDHDQSLDLAGMHVELFPTSHDVADPFGLRVSVIDEYGEVQDALGWCTDTGYLTADALGRLRGVRILGLEANHDVNMLAHGPYPAFLKARVGGDHGHLSNDQAADALGHLVGEDTETVVALHISQKNNTPGACVRTLADAVGAQVVDELSDGSLAEARTADGLLSICVASQDDPLVVW